MPAIPSGLDLTDGLNGRLGTPTPAGAVLVQSRDPVTGLPITDMDSIPPNENPGWRIERAEQATIRRSLNMSFSEAITRLLGTSRGMIKADSFGNITKILSAEVIRQKGGWAQMDIVEEGMSFDSPPDQFSLQPVELGVDIIKHPRYFYAFFGSAGYGGAVEQFNQQVIRLIQDYRENPNAAYRQAVLKILKDSLAVKTTGTPDEMQDYMRNGKKIPGFTIYGTEMAKRAAIEIIIKLWRGEETPYVVGWMVTHSYFSMRPVYMNPGGYIENPITQSVPQLPDYFFSPAWPPNTTTIFDQLAAINPQCYSTTGEADGAVNISWLRKADVLDFERTFFKITRTWIGSPIGYWDPELYSAIAAPAVPNDFIPLNTIV